MEIQYNISNGWPDFNADLSEQYAFACGGFGCDRGWTLQGGANFLKSRGVPDESCMPYRSGNLGKDLSCSATCSDIASRKMRILGYQQIGSFWGSPSVQEVKAALLRGPLLAGMRVYKDFMAYRSGVYRHVTGESLGGHAVTIVGYDDSVQAWIVKNSWGRNWGEGGYFRIAYGDISGVGTRVYSFRTPKRSGYVKLLRPERHEILRGKADITIENTFLELEDVGFRMAGVESSQTSPIMEATDGGDEAQYVNYVFDSKMYADGKYDLVAYARGENRSELSLHRTIYIANGELSAKVEMLYPTDQATLRNRVYMNIRCTATPVPLTDLTFFIRGTEERDIYVESPCPEIKMSWRTTSFKNGAYTLHAVGRHGPYQEYATPEVKVFVEN
jgi:hypothetical protein